LPTKLVINYKLLYIFTCFCDQSFCVFLCYCCVAMLPRCKELEILAWILSSGVLCDQDWIVLNSCLILLWISSLIYLCFQSYSWSEIWSEPFLLTQPSPYQISPDQKFGPRLLFGLDSYANPNELKLFWHPEFRTDPSLPEQTLPLFSIGSS
jgi:hypothetical protein